MFRERRVVECGHGEKEDLDGKLRRLCLTIRGATGDALDGRFEKKKTDEGRATHGFVE